LFAQVYRFRRVSGPVERQQTKWVVLGSATALLGFFGLVILQTVVPALSDTGSPLAIFMIGVAVSLFLLIPVSVAIAILRYRLWEIDVLINRALVYGSLTVSTAAVYIGGVIGLQALFRSISGQSSDLAVAIVTLAVAALFNPWRRRLQRFIDRRFYRQRYDAARALTVMSSRLRDEVDLDSLIGEIVSVVDQTVQPSHLALWLPAESAR
jgi:asparagine N-glycosylation enzyme membrane subunit Stt3